MKPARFAAAVIAALVLGLAAPAAMAADCAPKTTLGDVEDEVMCPVCGTPLALATEAPQANRERAFIQGLVDDCLTKDQVKDRLVAEYGSEVLSTPGRQRLRPGGHAGARAGGAAGPRRRWRRAAWQWRRTRRDQPGGPAAGGPDADGSKRLQDDLDRYGL